MAVIDLKNTTVKLYDGKDLDTTGKVAFPMVAANADFSAQAKIMASPDAPISLTLVDPGASGSFSIVVTGRTVVVNLAHSGSAITTTASALETSIAADAAAKLLITITQDETGVGILEAKALTSLTNPNSISIKIGEGNLTYSEKRAVEPRLDRGRLDTVREADQEMMDVAFDFTWEEITAATAASVPTVEDVLKRLDNASAWLNAATDPCRPTAVNISVENDPSCAGVQKEVTEILEFYHEALDHDSDAGQVSVSGRSNTQYATNVRIT